VARRSAAEAAETRGALVAAAREAFGQHGYAATSLEQISAAAGVTRGALHHHFGDKQQLFTEVFELLVDDINSVVVAAVAKAPPLEQLRVGCEALFAAMADPATRTIWLADAPAVLGLQRWYETDRARGMTTIAAGLEVLATAGLLRPELVEPLTVLLYGAMTESAISLAAREGGPGAATLIDAMEAMIAGVLRTT
jgi:AcrR family transcriptional regulator